MAERAPPTQPHPRSAPTRPRPAPRPNPGPAPLSRQAPLRAQPASPAQGAGQTAGVVLRYPSTPTARVAPGSAPGARCDPLWAGDIASCRICPAVANWENRRLSNERLRPATGCWVPGSRRGARSPGGAPVEAVASGPWSPKQEGAGNRRWQRYTQMTADNKTVYLCSRNTPGDPTAAP